jgi:hypothetical protein
VALPHSKRYNNAVVTIPVPGSTAMGNLEKISEKRVGFEARIFRFNHNTREAALQELTILYAELSLTLWTSAPAGNCHKSE